MKNIIRRSWYYVILVCFVSAIGASFVDTFIKSLGVAGDILWIFAFASYLASERIEKRHIFPSQKMFLYAFSSLFGMLAIDRLGRENHFVFGGNVLAPVYGFVASFWIVWLAFKLRQVAPDKTGSVRVWLYAALFFGIMLGMSLLKLYALWYAAPK